MCFAIFYMFFGVSLIAVSMSVAASMIYNKRFDLDEKIILDQKIILEVSATPPALKPNCTEFVRTRIDDVKNEEMIKNEVLTGEFLEQEEILLGHYAAGHLGDNISQIELNNEVFL